MGFRVETVGDKVVEDPRDRQVARDQRRADQKGGQSQQAQSDRSTGRRRAIAQAAALRT
ncbi:hypothetical protein QWZ10_03575 [Paracoccus cavernae]|uniref:Uncharacterized protein n=1 Tax=Paracoccus cavernae TaxID=1571207 RepID=A0ABT8D6T9_9RHOB|nr:hypothetical protein [Paracoccus cavernae]